MLSLQTVVPDTLELLRKIMGEPLFSDMRLVEGTALALQYGHRSSVDLDMFGTLNADNEDVEEVIGAIGNYTRIKVTNNIKIYQVNNIKVDFENYKYPWIDDMVEDEGIRLASPRDIAAMKINAIEGRGTRKDFIDIP